MAGMAPLALGPVEILVASFDGAESAAGMWSVLREQAQRGAIRVLDAVIVTKDTRCAIEWAEVDIDTGVGGSSADLELLVPGLAGDDDIQRLAEDVPAGCHALVVVFELTSARRLAERMSIVGADILTSEFIPANLATAMLELTLDEQGA